MEAVDSLEAFRRDPVGRYLVGPRWAVFCVAPDLFGHASWGLPEVDDVRHMLAACEVALRLPPHRYLVDLRALEGIQPATFGLFVDYTRRHGPALQRSIVRQGQLRPDGVVGAVISGFSQIARLPYPERVFDDVDALLAWLDVPHGVGVPLLARLGALRRDTRLASPVVAALRQLLAQGLGDPIADAARRLAMSPRALQRALRDAGTSYRQEVAGARLDAARRRLAASDEPLTPIAHDLGFASLQHFTTAFRKACGEPPSAWRQRHRG